MKTLGGCRRFGFVEPGYFFLPLRLAKSNLLLKLESAGWNDRIKLFVFARISNDISYVEEILDKIGYSFLASAIMNKNVITICKSG